jgi:hypothetical protein
MENDEASGGKTVEVYSWAISALVVVAETIVRVQKQK